MGNLGVVIAVMLLAQLRLHVGPVLPCMVAVHSSLMHQHAVPNMTSGRSVYSFTYQKSRHACLSNSFAVQLLLIDKTHLHVWDLARDHFVARKRISQQPLLAIFKSSGRCEFGVVSATAVDIWRVEQDLDYSIVLGGHTGPVIAVHAVNGAMVSPRITAAYAHHCCTPPAETDWPQPPQLW